MLLENPRPRYIRCSHYIKSILWSLSLYWSFLYSVYELKSQRRPGERFRWTRKGKVTTMTIAFVVAHVLFLTPIGIMNFYSRFFLGRKCHPCKILVYVFQKLSSLMAQTYCAINPWLWFIFSVKYRQGLKTFFKQKISQKNVHATILKGNIMGYDQYTVPDTVAVEPTFVAFLIAHANIRPWPLVPFFQISLKNSELKTTHNTFRAFFRQPFSK